MQLIDVVPSALCALAAWLVWPVFTEKVLPKPKVRPLTPDEKAAWGLYIIEDRVKVARMRSTREKARHMWDLNRQQAEAIRVWRTRNIGRMAV